MKSAFNGKKLDLCSYQIYIKVINSYLVLKIVEQNLLDTFFALHQSLDTIAAHALPTHKEIVTP
jgi:hypothetical protein